MKTLVLKSEKSEFKSEDVMKVTSNAYKANKKAIDREILLLTSK